MNTMKDIFYSTISNAHEGERERESVIELNLEVQKNNYDNNYLTKNEIKK